MAEIQNQDQVHREGTDHIKEQVFGQGQGQQAQGTTADPARDGSLPSGSTSATPTANPSTDGSEPGTASAPPIAERTETQQSTSGNTEGDALNKTETSGENSHKPPAEAGGKPLENRDAIPTAGGERLGDKHWGESKIVPDNPPKEPTGVASSDGQPTDEVKDNTAKNTGGASGPHDDGEKKGGLIDKIKDKLPGGKKD